MASNAVPQRSQLAWTNSLMSFHSSASDGRCLAFMSFMLASSVPVPGPGPAPAPVPGPGPGRAPGPRPEPGPGPGPAPRPVPGPAPGPGPVPGPVPVPGPGPVPGPIYCCHKGTPSMLFLAISVQGSISIVSNSSTSSTATGNLHFSGLLVPCIAIWLSDAAPSQYHSLRASCRVTSRPVLDFSLPAKAPAEYVLTMTYFL